MTNSLNPPRLADTSDTPLVEPHRHTPALDEPALEAVHLNRGLPRYTHLQGPTSRFHYAPLLLSLAFGLTAALATLATLSARRARHQA